MTDYWHSFSAPPQPRDLEEHLPTDISHSSSVVSTPSPISTSTSSSSSQRTIVETGSLLKSSVWSASEQSLLLAQRSKTSLNRLLDTVMDNATTLAESSSANCAYSDSEDKPSLLKGSAPTPTRISPSSCQPSRAKFFVCDSDEEEDEEEEEFFFPRRSEDNFGDFEDSGTDEAETEEEEEGFVMRAPNTPSPKPAPGMVRRQSLLSDLFLAEKQREQLHPSKSIRPSLARTSSTYSSRCPSTANSDGESTFSQMAPVPEDHQDHSQHHHRRHHRPQRINLDAGSEIQEPEEPKSPLVRTKRVFKNLDGLASLSTTSPTCNITSSFSPSSSSPSSSTPNSTSTSPTALAAWTRSHQVQVQIQSLVVQSTSSAQRALLSASATLTDVLFRTK
ncbi:hypothetical protein BGZ82_002382 [Podila clonocystis]|nr:hypothetical protein BGZ82_002382 [Podila clonocystis]